MIFPFKPPFRSWFFHCHVWWHLRVTIQCHHTSKSGYHIFLVITSYIYIPMNIPWNPYWPPYLDLQPMAFKLFRQLFPHWRQTLAVPAVWRVEFHLSRRVPAGSLGAVQAWTGSQSSRFAIWKPMVKWGTALRICSKRSKKPPKL